MAFEQQLTFVNFEVFDSGNRQLGLTDIELPEFNLKTVDISGAGLLGEYSAPVPGMAESMEVKLKWRVLNVQQGELFRHIQHRITCRGSQEFQQTGTGIFRQVPVRIEISGVPKTYSTGKFEPASTTDSELTVEISRLEIVVDNKQTTLLDKFNYIWKVNGVDEMAAIRKNLGIA